MSRFRESGKEPNMFANFEGPFGGEFESETQKKTVNYIFNQLNKSQIIKCKYQFSLICNMAVTWVLLPFSQNQHPPLHHMCWQ